MCITFKNLCCGLVCAAGLLLTGHTHAEPAATTQLSARAPAVDPAQPGSMPNLVINREQGYVDIDATVVLREGGWLELLACTPGTRTHESILVVHALPSHIHLALMMLGLEPGAPMQWRHENGQEDGQENDPKTGQSKVILPYGPPVAVAVVVDPDGQPVEIPANQWVLDRTTGKPMGDNHWLFAGSFIYEQEGLSPYQADVSGSVVSIVNFGDEVLARRTDSTNENDGQGWGPNTNQIPELGAHVLLRLRPAPAPKQ